MNYWWCCDTLVRETLSKYNWEVQADRSKLTILIEDSLTDGREDVEHAVEVTTASMNRAASNIYRRENGGMFPGWFGTERILELNDEDQMGELFFENGEAVPDNAEMYGI
jgi:hypothetical protein